MTPHPIAAALAETSPPLEGKGRRPQTPRPRRPTVASLKGAPCTHNRPSRLPSTARRGAMQAPREEFVYLACLHRYGVDAPTSRVVDSRNGRIVHETPMRERRGTSSPFGWNRCSSACHGSRPLAPDRARLPLVADRHPGVNSILAPDREVSSRRSWSDKTLHPPHTSTACRATTSSSACWATPTRGTGGFAVLDARTSRQGPLGDGAPSPRSATTSGTSRAEHARLVGVREPNAYEPGLVHRGRVGRAATASGCTSGTWQSGGSSRPSTSRGRLIPWRPLAARSRRRSGFVGATLASNIIRFHRTNGSFQGRTRWSTSRTRSSRAPLPGGVPGLITDVVLSMDDRFLYFSTAARGPAPVRRLRPGHPSSPSALARRASGSTRATRAASWRRAADAPALASTAVACTSAPRFTRAGTTVLSRRAPGFSRLDCDPGGGMAVDRDSSSTSTTAPASPREPDEVRSRRRLHHGIFQ